jgi:hypothetical protein
MICSRCAPLPSMGRLLFVVVILGACAHHTNDGTPDASDPLSGITALSIKPIDQTLVVVQGQPATSGYVAIATYADGHFADVSPYVQWSLEDATLGGFTVADLTTTTTHGGKTIVNAVAGALHDSTGLTVRLQQTWNDPGSTTLPVDPAAPFSGPPAAARNPTLVYPNNGVLVPPNLGRLEMHFRPGPNNTLFELTFSNTVLDLKIYLRCTQPMNGGCIYLPDPQVWSWLAETNRGAEPVQWSLRATDDAGTGVGSSTAMAIQFAPEDLTGGIYYWTTTLKAIMRYDFASTTQTMATQYLGTEMSNGACIGCHALSRDGTKMVAEAGGQNDGRTLLLDVATKTAMIPFGSTPKSNFESWNHDGSAYVGVYGDNGATDFNLMLFDGSTGAQTQTIPAGGTSTNPTDHPDWSPVDDRIAFVNVGVKQTLQKMFNGEIRTVTKTGGTWSTPQVLVPRAAGKNRYYPAFAPDGQVLVFDQSTCNTGNTGVECDADTDPTATLYTVNAVSGGTPVALTRANAPGIADGTTTALASSFPKWNPTVFAHHKTGGRIAWMTFSSTRMYGLRTPPGAGTLLWLVAVDLDAPAGTDPSYPALALPFQDLATSNHIAQWTTKIVGIQ